MFLNQLGKEYVATGAGYRRDECPPRGCDLWDAGAADHGSPSRIRVVHHERLSRDAVGHGDSPANSILHESVIDHPFPAEHFLHAEHVVSPVFVAHLEGPYAS